MKSVAGIFRMGVYTPELFFPLNREKEPGKTMGREI